MSNHIELEQQIRNLNHKNHLCLIYEKDPIEQMPALIPFIKQGLESNEQFIYIADDLEVEELYFILKINGINVDLEISKGALKLWTRKEWRQPGELDLQKKSLQVKTFAADAINAGFNGIRFAVEMTWTLGPDIEAHKLEKWEAAINNLFPQDFPFKIICQYNKQKLPASVINQAFRTHPDTIIENSIYENTFYENYSASIDPKEDENKWIISNLKQNKSSVKREPIDYSNLQWGTHICNFYNTSSDLLQFLIPYFKAGLERNEMCIWVTSEPLVSDAAQLALSEIIPNLDDYINAGQIEIIDAEDWYIRNGSLKPTEEILDSWIEKEKEALKKEFSGLRISGNTYWLDRKDWDDFEKYESMINNYIHKYKIVVLCSYSLEKCFPPDIVSAASLHECSFVKRNDKIERFENSKKAKAESILKEAYEELESRINQRTAALSKSLHEKEILLKEIHHRVKNNMQIISSLISLQCMKLNDAGSINLLEECRSRIRAMSLVHETLYNSDISSKLYLDPFVKNLCAELLKTNNIDSEKIEISLDIKDVSLDMNSGIAFGLILNELLTNSFKHAFTNGNGRINISFSVTSNNAKLVFSDNGIGLPKNINIDKTNSLGLKLINALTAQLQGSLKIKNDTGALFEIVFPIS